MRCTERIEVTNSDKVLTAIKDYWGEYTIPPTIRAVQKITGINSSSLVRSYYLQLETQGEIKRIKSKPVPIQIYKMIRRTLT